MQDTNFIADALVSLREAQAGIGPHTPLCRAFADGLEGAQKFRLPDRGRLLDWSKLGYNDLLAAVKDYIPALRLPYEYCAFEFWSPKCGERVVILAREHPPAQIVLCWVTRIGSGPWFLSDFKLAVRRSEDGLLTLMGEPCWSDDDGYIESQEAANVAISVAEVVMQVIAALACKNVSTSIRQASERLNKKRISKGKQPFFTYRTIDLLLPRKDRSEPFGGSHAPPRIHLRRGHIRRHPTAGQLWVNACVVGNKTLGMVGKDYRVHKPRAAA